MSWYLRVIIALAVGVSGISVAVGLNRWGGSQPLYPHALAKAAAPPSQVSSPTVLFHVVVPGNVIRFVPDRDNSADHDTQLNNLISGLSTKYHIRGIDRHYRHDSLFQMIDVVIIVERKRVGD